MADATRPSKSLTNPMAMNPIYVLNGPNLNLLGQREPQLYGSATLRDIETRLRSRAATLGLAIDFRQSNHEGELIDWVHEARQKASGIIVNAAGLTHTSVALLDALLAADVPVIEVHLTNIYRREAFRHHSYVSQAATGIICGLGAKGYELALDALAERLQSDVEKLDV
jgi:3-dehydroquinate dehydratase II